MCLKLYQVLLFKSEEILSYMGSKKYYFRDLIWNMSLILKNQQHFNDLRKCFFGWRKCLVRKLSKIINQFVLNAPFLYTLKTSENLVVF